MSPNLTCIWSCYRSWWSRSSSLEHLDVRVWRMCAFQRNFCNIACTLWPSRSNRRKKVEVSYGISILPHPLLLLAVDDESKLIEFKYIEIEIWIEIIWMESNYWNGIKISWMEWNLNRVEIFWIELKLFESNWNYLFYFIESNWNNLNRIEIIQSNRGKYKSVNVPK